MFLLTRLSKILAPNSVIMLSFAQGANAMWIESGFYDSQAKSIVLEVSYGGDCLDHKFKLSIDSCGHSSPKKCLASLTELTEPDICRGNQKQTLAFSRVELGLDDNQFDNATIDIAGILEDRDAPTNETLIILNSDESASRSNDSMFGCYNVNEVRTSVSNRVIDKIKSKSKTICIEDDMHSRSGPIGKTLKDSREETILAFNFENMLPAANCNAEKCSSFKGTIGESANLKKINSQNGEYALSITHPGLGGNLFFKLQKQETPSEWIH